MQQLELMLIHIVMNYFGVGKLVQAWNSPQIEGYRTYVSAFFLAVIQALHYYKIQPFDNDTVYSVLKGIFLTTGSFGLYEKFQRNVPHLDLVKGALGEVLKQMNQNKEVTK